MRTPQDEAKQLGKAIADNFEDEEVKGGVIDLAVQMYQPTTTARALPVLTLSGVSNNP